jgi:TonB family protein
MRKFSIMIFLNPCRRALICLALTSCGAPGLRADVTIRYQANLKPAAGLPPAMEQAVNAAQYMPSSTLICMKGHQAYSASDDRIAIIDIVKQEMTLIDASHKTFATFPISEFASKIAAAMPAGQTVAAKTAMASIKTKVDSKMTGRTETIQNVRSEEREITISMDMQMPPTLPQTGPSTRLVMQIWTAQQGEALRVPAIRELTGFNLWQKYFLNPLNMVEKLGANSPGAAGMITPIVEELYRNQSVILRMHVDVYMPTVAAMAQQMARQTENSAAAIDPNAPIVEMSQEVVELSSAPVDASLFEIPKEYAAVPADDLIRATIPNRVQESQKPAGEIAAQATADQAKPGPAAPPSEGGVYRLGGGVSAPIVIYKKDPGYTEEARKGNLWGTVVLQIVVGADGLPHNMRVVRRLGMGLDEKAVEAVSVWRFRPGVKQGNSVAVMATVEVNFRLLGNHSAEPDHHVWRIGRLVFEGGGPPRPVLTKWHLPDGPVPDHDLRMTFRLTVDASGRVTDVSAEGTSDPALAVHLEEAVRKWKFQVPDGSNAANYSATLDLAHGNPLPARIQPPSAGEIRAEPKNAEETYGEAVQLIRTKVPGEAIALLTKVIQEKPDWDAAYSARAQAYYNMKLYYEAVDDLTVAIRLDPKQASFYDRRGLSYSYAGRHDIANRRLQPRHRT